MKASARLSRFPAEPSSIQEEGWRVRATRVRTSADPQGDRNGRSLVAVLAVAGLAYLAICRRA